MKPAIPASGPLVLLTANDKTRATGVYRVDLSAPTADPAKIVMLDKQLGGLMKAKNADVYVFTQQRFDEFPDLWVSGPDFAAAARSATPIPSRPNTTGARPSSSSTPTPTARSCRPSWSSPRTSTRRRNTRSWSTSTRPRPWDSTATSRLRRARTSISRRYVSNGYVLLSPDIVYEDGYPGPSSLKCVIPAVEKVLDMGFIDPKRIGIQGHSWGGYEISYMITQTDIFAAVEAGASVVNMTSAYGGIRWGTGMSRAFQYEKTQSRIGAPLWGRVLQFIENSPLFWVERVQTPYLTIHNDEDDAVPWYQGIEFFSALRRLGKEAYMFNFNGEKHGLRERDNQKYWTVHLDEFFDHLPSRQAHAGVDGEGRPLSRAGQARHRRALQDGRREESGRAEEVAGVGRPGRPVSGRRGRRWTGPGPGPSPAAKRSKRRSPRARMRRRTRRPR